jgi:hypothetical protein
MAGFKIATVNYVVSETENNKKWIQARFLTTGFLDGSSPLILFLILIWRRGKKYTELTYWDIQSAGSLDVRWIWDFSQNPIQAYVEDLNQYRQFTYVVEVSRCMSC